MDFDFLKQFPKRMKSVGAYALLFKNSMQKGTWKQYGFEEFYEQTNLTFAVLLYIMEQSLKSEPCTMDDIGSFIDMCNMRWFHRPISYEECKELGDFILNVILCDEGKAMYFKGFDFEEGNYRELHISFVASRILYLEDDIKRTSYYLTEEGYNLMLSTLELESNMKLTIHEMIFQLHLEKASYDKAVEDIKNIFNLLRIQLQKMQEAMLKIRQNALRYSVLDYKTLLEENLNTLSDSKDKFIVYRDSVSQRVTELEEQDINIKKLDKKDSDNLKNLKIIGGYLSRAIEEQQKILLAHFDLKSLYTKELEDLSQMAFIKRFSLRNELYDKIIKNPDTLSQLDIFLRPLFNRNLEKSYNISKALEFQRPMNKKEVEEEEEILSFGEEEWQEEQKRKLKEKKRQYENSLKLLLSHAIKKKGISLMELTTKLTEDEKTVLIPKVEIFKEIMIELLKVRTIDIQGLLSEQQEHFKESIYTFGLKECILDMTADWEELKDFRYIAANRIEGNPTVLITGLTDESGKGKKIRCSDVYFTVE